MVLAGATVLLLALIVGSAVAASRLGYFPPADEAVHAVRADDVLGPNSPLLGMPSSTERLIGVYSYHPGPLVFWAYAVPVRLFGYGTGLLLGAAAVNVLAAIGIAVTANRRSGAWIASVAVLLTIAVYLAITPAVLYRPLNGAIPVLPFLCFLLLTWAVADQDHRLLPAWVLAGSFVLQAHLGFGILVAVMAAVVMAIPVHDALTAFRGRHRSPPRAQPRRADADDLAIGATVAVAIGALLAVVSASRSRTTWVVAAAIAAAALAVAALVVGRRWWASRRHPTWTSPNRLIIASAVVLAICWSAPAGDAVVNAGGNVRALAQAAVADVPTFGWPYASAALRTMTRPPLPTRYYGQGAVTATWSPVSLALFLGLAIAVAIVWRRSDRTTRRLVAAAAAALGAGALSASRIPTESGYQPFSTIWLIPIEAFAWLAVIAVAIGSAPTRAGRRRRGMWAAVATLALVAVSLPRLQWPALDQGDNWHYEAIAALGPPAVAAAAGQSGPFAVAYGGGTRMRDLSRTLLAYLESRGVDTLTRTLVPDFGAGRRLGDDTAGVAGTFWVLRAGTRHAPRGAERIAVWRPAADARLAAGRLADDVREFLRAAGPLRLDAAQRYTEANTLYGTAPHLCPPEGPRPADCDQGLDLAEEANRLVETAPDVILALYHAELVTAPQLPPDLAGRVFTELIPVGTEVWLAPPP